MMRKDEVERYARQRPFVPFEVRMTDGQVYRFRKVEQFLVGRNHIHTLDRKGGSVFISIDVISTINPITRAPRRRSRGA